MPHKDLNRPKVSIIFKKVGSETVAERMNRRRFCNAGLVFSNLKDMLNISWNDGLTRNTPREKKVRRSVELPVEPERFKVFMR